MENNGLSLCALHHKIFDLGTFTIPPDSYKLAFSQQVEGDESTKYTLPAQHGKLPPFFI